MSLVRQLKKDFATTRSNIFGTIGSGTGLPIIPPGIDFIPTDGKGGVINVGNGGSVDADWLGLSSKRMQFWAYLYCSPLAAVIDKLAEADTNGIITFVDQDGDTKKNWKKSPMLKRVYDLMNKPNPFQTREEFNTEQIALAKIFGYCPVLNIKPKGDIFDNTWTKYQFNLNPCFIEPVFNNSFNPVKPMSNPIKQWKATVNGEDIFFDGDDILLINDGLILKDGLPLSKVSGLDFDISNICAAKEADNVLLKKKGPLGVFSLDPKPDMAGWNPMKPGEKSELQKDLSQYGLTVGQLQYIISKVPLKWNAMSFNVQELQTKETVRASVDSICDRMGFPAELMSGKNATYENRSSAERYLYQNNVIPFSLRKCARYNYYFGLEDIRIVSSFSHLPVLQEDVLKTGQSEEALSKGLQIDYMAGIITKNEYRARKGMEQLDGGDTYYEAPDKTTKKQDNAQKDTTITE